MLGGIPDVRLDGVRPATVEEGHNLVKANHWKQSVREGSAGKVFTFFNFELVILISLGLFAWNLIYWSRKKTAGTVHILTLLPGDDACDASFQFGGMSLFGPSRLACGSKQRQGVDTEVAAVA
jgi:hypothetical protein